MSRPLHTAWPSPVQILALAFVWAAAALPAWPQGASHPQPAPQTQEAPRQFTKVCALCHGADARGTDRAPSLVNTARLRGMTDGEIAKIIRQGKDKMPAFPLPQADIDALTRYMRFLNPAEAEAAVAGDPKTGERIFFGGGQCSTCHMAGGRGRANGPDLSSVGRRLKLEELIQSLTDPDAKIADGWGTVSTQLNDGSTLRGFARAQGSHDLVLQTEDGKLRLLLDSEYKALSPDKHSTMPAYKGTAGEQRDLIAFLSSLKGAGAGSLQSRRRRPPRRRSTRLPTPSRAIGPHTTALWTATA